MRARQALAIGVATLMAVPAPALADDPGVILSGVVKSVTGSPLADVDLDFVNLASGASRTARTDAAGGLQVALEPGSYSVEARGYSIVRGPRTITVTQGQASTAEFTLKGQDPGAVPVGAGAGAASGRDAGKIVALTLFTGALVGVAIRAGTFKPASPSR